MDHRHTVQATQHPQLMCWSLHDKEHKLFGQIMADIYPVHTVDRLVGLVPTMSDTTQS